MAMSPDIVTDLFDDSPNPRRRRRHRPGQPAPIDALPAEWKSLAALWLHRASKNATACHWNTLAADAGPQRYTLAGQLLEHLLDRGWVALTEDRRHGAWWPSRIEFRHMPQLRQALGLPDIDAQRQIWVLRRTDLVQGDEAGWSALIADLDALPPQRAVARADLLLALRRWRAEERCGTRRDFAQFARDTTKSVTDAEWRWLERTTDLAACGIERHTPLLLLAAPLRLRLPTGIIDLGCSPDFLAVTPACLDTAQLDGTTLERWRLVENLTSFERVARQREAGTGVVWLPGYPPGGWQTAMRRLLALAPRGAEIACDPDPAGIGIALAAGALWEESGLPWHPWWMNVDLLARLPRRQALSAIDRDMLDRLQARSLPTELTELAAWMQSHGEKGEQEGYL